MNSGLKISEAVGLLYICFNGSTVERRPSFFHLIYQTVGQGLYPLKKYYV